MCTGKNSLLVNGVAIVESDYCTVSGSNPDQTEDREIAGQPTFRVILPGYPSDVLYTNEDKFK